MVKFLDLQRINDSFEPELTETVNRVIRSGWYLLGEETDVSKRNIQDILACPIRWDAPMVWMR